MDYSNYIQLEADTTELNENIKNEIEQISLDIENHINITDKPKKGRKPGQKNKKYNYNVQFYDVFQKQFIQLFDGYTFEDIKEQLQAKYNLMFSVSQLKGIYTNKDHQFIKIHHL